MFYSVHAEYIKAIDCWERVIASDQKFRRPDRKANPLYLEAVARLQVLAGLLPEAVKTYDRIFESISNQDVVLGRNLVWLAQDIKLRQQLGLDTAER